jgi:site-specific DNA-methyltransferase (adenine-specific)
MEPTILQNSTIYNADCFDVFAFIEDKSIDAIICDLPYGTTACKWDSVLPFDKLWKQYERVIKGNGAMVLFCSQPFTSNLITSNIQNFKYMWYWEKSRPSGYVHARNMPMKEIEDIAVFSYAPMGHYSLLGKNRMKYNPQGLVKINKLLKQKKETRASNTYGIRPSHKDEFIQENTNYPRNKLVYASVTGATHPTEKPVLLLEYLIKTYTNEGETVLDNTMGSGTTGVACINSGRNFIGIEKEKNYFDIAVKRIKEAGHKLFV